MKQTHHIGYVQTPSVKNLSNVKNALVENGLVPLTTPNEMLPDAIEKGLENLKPENVRGNVKIGNVVGSLATDWEGLSLEGKKQTLQVDFSNSIVTSDNKYIYGGYDSYSSKEGIYRFDIETETIHKLYETGKWISFFESSNGIIYAGGKEGVVKIENNIATKIFTHTSTSYSVGVFVETPDGDIYASGNGSACQLIYIHNGKASNVYDKNNAILNSAYLGYLYKTKTGDVYAISFGSSTNIYYLNKGYGTYLFSGQYPYYAYEDDGYLYFSASYPNNVGLYKIKAGVYERLYSSYKWAFNLKSSDGSLYFSPPSTQYGILKVKDGVASLIYSSAYDYIMEEDSHGNIYAAAKSYNSGLLHINKSGSVTKLISTWSGGLKLLEVDGNVYCGSTSEGTTPLVKLDGTTVTTLYAGAGAWSNYYVDKNKNIYISSKELTTYRSTAEGILLLKDDNVIKVYPTGVDWKFVKEKEQGVIASQTEDFVPNSNALLLDGTNVYGIKL